MKPAGLRGQACPREGPRPSHSSLRARPTPLRLGWQQGVPPPAPGHLQLHLAASPGTNKQPWVSFWGNVKATRSVLFCFVFFQKYIAGLGLFMKGFLLKSRFLFSLSWSSSDSAAGCTRRYGRRPAGESPQTGRPLGVAQHGCCREGAGSRESLCLRCRAVSGETCAPEVVRRESS